jgi:two-component system chemotaxis response regulator CheY
MREKILIIDDELEVCNLLKDFLEIDGYEVDYSINAREGLEKFREKRPGVVLLDIRMPDMNGITAVEEIRKTDKKCDIIMCTAVVDQEVIDEAFKTGANDYILKPFDLEDLLKKIRERMNL